MFLSAGFGKRETSISFLPGSGQVTLLEALFKSLTLYILASALEVSVWLMENWLGFQSWFMIDKAITHRFIWRITFCTKS